MDLAGAQLLDPALATFKAMMPDLRGSN